MDHTICLEQVRRFLAPPSDDAGSPAGQQRDAGNRGTAPATSSPLLLFLPMRLGLGLLDVCRHASYIRALLSHPCSIGIVGGRPRHSLYIVGYQGARAAASGRTARLPRRPPTRRCRGATVRRRPRVLSRPARRQADGGHVSVGLHRRLLPQLQPAQDAFCPHRRVHGCRLPDPQHRRVGVTVSIATRGASGAAASAGARIDAADGVCATAAAAAAAATTTPAAVRSCDRAVVPMCSLSIRWLR